MTPKSMLFAIGFCSLLCLEAPAQEEKSAKEGEKTYTEEEFQKAVQEEVAETMEKMGQGNLVDLMKELMEKEERIKLQKLKIKKKREELKANMKDIEKRVQEFSKEQQDFLGCIDEKEKNKVKRVDHMVDVVSGMTSERAAEVLSVQDADISVQILERLNPETVAKIFNKMDKEISARLQKQFLDMKK